MKLGLAVHPGKSMALGIARDVVRALDGRCEIVVADPVPEGAGLPGPRARIESMHVDAIVAIGGDGTFLRVLRLNAAPRASPCPPRRRSSPAWTRRAWTGTS